MSQGKKRIRKACKKRVAAAVAAACLFASAPVGMPTAQAFWGGLGNVLGTVIGGAVQAQNTRDYYLTMGNNPNIQNANYLLALQNAANRDRPVDPEAVKLTNEIMNTMIENGDYVLRNNSLPFRWEVVADDTFNASCYFSNFICVHDGFIQKCGYNRDEVAAVLGHEMTHGYDQHIANLASRKILTSATLSAVTGALATTNAGVYVSATNLPDALINFITVKNTDVKNEKDADKYGFYVMSSAGFNPGGAAAAMARMSYYTAHRDQVSDFFNPSDHPDTRKRLKDMAELLHKYGIGHTQVLNVNDVYFDKELLLTAEPEGPQDAEEMAYLISGGIAKGFHDHRFVTDWNFHTLQDGTIDFLDNNPAYAPLKNALRTEKGLGERFQALVERAYANDVKSGAREKFLKDELARKQHNRELRQKMAARKEDSDDKSVNGNIYMKLGLTELAEKEYKRSAKLDKDNPSAKSGMAMVMSSRGNNTEALKLVNEAIAMNPNLGASYVARAEIYKNMGDTDSALNDCNMALSVSDSSTYAYKLAGDIFHAQGAADSALMEYRAYHKAMPEANDIPEEYKSQLN